MNKLTSKLTLTLLAGVLIGGSLIAFTNNQDSDNNTFKTQSDIVESFVYHCSQTIIYDDLTKESTKFYGKENNTSERNCIDNEKCQGLKQITTECKPRN